MSRCLIDANWGNSTDVVHQYCRECTAFFAMTWWRVGRGKFPETLGRPSPKRGYSAAELTR